MRLVGYYNEIRHLPMITMYEEEDIAEQIRELNPSFIYFLLEVDYA